MRDFHSIPTLQEVECWGGVLETEVKVLSLTIYNISDNSVLGHVNPLTNECVTFRYFSSCFIDTRDTRQTKLRVLVYDLGENESRKYGCNCTSFRSVGEAEKVTWSVLIKGPSMFFILETNYLAVMICEFYFLLFLFNNS